MPNQPSMVAGKYSEHVDGMDGTSGRSCANDGVNERMVDMNGRAALPHELD